MKQRTTTKQNTPPPKKKNNNNNKRPVPASSASSVLPLCEASRWGVGGPLGGSLLGHRSRGDASFFEVGSGFVCFFFFLGGGGGGRGGGGGQKQCFVGVFICHWDPWAMPLLISAIPESSRDLSQNPGFGALNKTVFLDDPAVVSICFMVSYNFGT